MSQVHIRHGIDSRKHDDGHDRLVSEMIKNPIIGPASGSKNAVELVFLGILMDAEMYRYAGLCGILKLPLTM